MFKQILKFIKRTALFNILRNFRQRRRDNKQHQAWLNSDKMSSPPHIVKQMVVKEYANRYNIRVFVETGTFLGDMVYGVQDTFDQIYSVELGDELYERCKRRFSRQKHISILKGDSANVLPDILTDIKAPCLFWLDGHYSAGITAKGEKETPILEELQPIFNHPIDSHVILIDDARAFTGQKGYPTIKALQDLVLARCPNSIFKVKKDIIRIHHEYSSNG